MNAGNSSDLILADVFRKRIKSLGVIFNSYSSLYDVYHGVLKQAALSKDKLTLFENVKKSAQEKESELSDALHTQAYILMTGSAEALLKDLHDDLILENFTRLNNLSDVKFTVGEMTRIIKEGEQTEFVSLKLGESVIKQLSSNTRNPTEKANFQNVQSTRDEFSRLFGIKIDTEADVYKRIRAYWYKRHSLVHSSGIADKRYVDNMQKAGFDAKEGQVIVISKSAYDAAVQDFASMFTDIEKKITELDLQYKGVG